MAVADPALRDPTVRLGALCDSGTLRLLSEEDHSGVVIARGFVFGRAVIAYATSTGGSLGADGCARIVWAVDAAAREGIVDEVISPDSTRRRIVEGLAAAGTPIRRHDSALVR